MSEFFRSRRVAVTGGSGFLGSFVVDRLRQAGNDPFVPRKRDYDLRSQSAIRRFLAEGYLWQEGDGILMGGVRFFGARLSADLGVVTTLGGGDTFVFPVVNVVWTF